MRILNQILLLTSSIDDASHWIDPIIAFFRRFGELGLFLYSIIETITPLAGVEFFLVPMIIDSPDRWLLLTLNLVLANALGAVIVYLFMAKEDNFFYRKIVSKKNQDKAKKLFNRYGFWAVFIFAMTPLPFFVILFTVSLGGMKFTTYLLSTIVSRGLRFLFTTYFIHRAVIAGTSVNTGWIILWLTIIGVAFTVIMVLIQKLLLIYFEKKIEN